MGGIGGFVGMPPGLGSTLVPRGGERGVEAVRDWERNPILTTRPPGDKTIEPSSPSFTSFSTFELPPKTVNFFASEGGVPPGPWHNGTRDLGSLLLS